jgi:hypothetical protein
MGVHVCWRLEHSSILHRPLHFNSGLLCGDGHARAPSSGLQKVPPQGTTTQRTAARHRMHTGLEASTTSNTLG